jgi:hypothetical protein
MKRVSSLTISLINTLQLNRKFYRNCRKTKRNPVVIILQYTSQLVVLIMQPVGIQMYGDIILLWDEARLTL